MLETGFEKGNLLDGGVPLIHDGIYLHTNGSSVELAVNHWGFGKMQMLLGTIKSWLNDPIMRSFEADALIRDCDEFLCLSKDEYQQRLERLTEIPEPTEVAVQGDLTGTKWDVGDFLVNSDSPVAQMFAPREADTLHKQRNLDYEKVAEELRNLAKDSINNRIHVETAPDRTRVEWIDNSHPGAKELDPVVIKLNIAFRERLSVLGFQRGDAEKSKGYELHINGMTNAKKFRSNNDVEGPFISVTAETPEIRAVLAKALVQLYGLGIIERRETLTPAEAVRERSGESMYAHGGYPLLVRSKFGDSWDE